MAFESLTDKLQNVFKNLSKKRPSDGSRCKIRFERGQNGASRSRCKF